jgi:hypothetical protein
VATPPSPDALAVPVPATVEMTLTQLVADNYYVLLKHLEICNDKDIVFSSITI